LLGIHPYDETWADGLQLLRYNISSAYHNHMDWIKGNGDPKVHNWDSAGQGTNRFATVLLYLSDVKEGDGGETVFTQIPRIVNNTSNMIRERERARREMEVEAVAEKEVREKLPEELETRNLTYLFPPHSWQREMLVTCRTRLSVKPQHSHALLFYSQTPEGHPDYRSTHGGCPVLAGEKWAANVWVWNGPRQGYWEKDEETGIMIRPDSNEQNVDKQVQVLFHVESVVWERLGPTVGLGLFWVPSQKDREPTYFGPLSLSPMSMNSFPGHTFEVRYERKRERKKERESEREMVVCADEREREIGSIVRRWSLGKQLTQDLVVRERDLET